MSRISLLFVDDDEFNASRYVEALLDEGFDVHFARSSDEALKAAGSGEFDGVILDVMMPPGQSLDLFETAGGFRTGKALARKLRPLLPKAKLIAFSATRDQEILEWFNRDDSVTFIDKYEVLPSQFPSLIRKILFKKGEPPRVFIVHGRDHLALLELKDFLQNRLGLPEPMVLAEQPSRGLTIVEKFETYASQADLVFVLLTPDDLGSLQTDTASLALRPRMNVLFEYGFFLGSLRRRAGRVFLLKKGDLEIPSDLQGVVAIDITNGVAAAGEDIRREVRDWL